MKLPSVLLILITCLAIIGCLYLGIRENKTYKQLLLARSQAETAMKLVEVKDKLIELQKQDIAKYESVIRGR